MGWVLSVATGRGKILNPQLPWKTVHHLSRRLSIINLNLQGFYFQESYTTLLLARILTPFSTGFMDLQSPAGAGISGANGAQIN